MNFWYFLIAMLSFLSYNFTEAFTRSHSWPGRRR
ncbi:hypothetical protein V3C99_013601 [Haemonchus contortus]